MNQSETANLLNYRRKLTGAQNHFTEEESENLIREISDNSIKGVDKIHTKCYIDNTERVTHNK